LFDYVEKKNQEMEDAKKAESSIGTINTLGREEQEQKDEKDREEKKEMDVIKKRIKKIFVDSNHFYMLNRVFFVLILLFELSQSMAYNSCSDIPALLMILVMFAFYAYRKANTRKFLQYTFIVVYFIQFIITLKIINEIVRNIDFAKKLMEENHDSTFVQANDILFGAQRTQDNLSPD